MRHLSLSLHETASRYPDTEAIVFEDERITWSELESQVDLLAGTFLTLGVRKGERIGIFCSTRPEYVYTYLAAARVGAILTGFNIRYTAREVIELADQVEPVVMIVLGDIKTAKRLKPIIETRSYVKHLISLGQTWEGWLNFEQMFERQDEGIERALAKRAATLSEEDDALMVFTGGVDGTIRGALLSHKNIVATISVQNRTLGWQPGDRIIQHLPMNHVSGATLITVGGMLVGGTLIMLDRFRPERLLELVERERVTILGQVPTMWIMELLLPNLKDFDLSSIRVSIVSGGYAPDDLLRHIAGIGAHPIHAYGLTEASGMVTYSRMNRGGDLPLRSTGMCPAEFELRIANGSGQPVKPGVDGEIELRGDCVMSGYYCQPDATAAVIAEDGWMRTGDVGNVDENGNLTITGRSKEMYISGGYNVYPAEVESYLNQHPDIEQCASVGAPEPIYGEIGAAWIVPRKGSDLSVSQIRRYCKRGLARYKNPRHLEFRDQLPMNGDGTVDKKVLAGQLI